MGLKKRSRVSAEFSMSSLTDIIFLLLIFFMLTSSLVKIASFELPESENKTVAPQSMVVEIRREGGDFQVYASGDLMRSGRQIERTIQREKGRSQDEEFTVTIAAEKGAPFRYVLNVMKAANNQRVRAILATQPKE